MPKKFYEIEFCLIFAGKARNLTKCACHSGEGEALALLANTRQQGCQILD
jgi:hypothetical protein